MSWFDKTYRVLVKGRIEFLFTFNWRGKLKRIQETTNINEVREIYVYNTAVWGIGKPIFGNKITIDIMQKTVMDKTKGLMFWHYNKNEFFRTMVIDFDSV